MFQFVVFGKHGDNIVKLNHLHNIHFFRTQYFASLKVISKVGLDIVHFVFTLSPLIHGCTFQKKRKFQHNTRFFMNIIMGTLCGEIWKHFMLL